MTIMPEEIFDYPVDGILDLHMFRPKDVKSVLIEYLAECRARGILRVRIIHGKGQGVLREIVRSYLKSAPYVREFSTASDASSWGATIAILDPLERENGTTDERG
jgi:DNA-nicking Smr family endonuclease